MNEKYKALYEAANALMTRLGADGQIQADCAEAEALNNALYDLDEGLYDPERFMEAR